MTMKIDRPVQPLGLAIILVMTLLQGCSQINDTSDLQQYVQETQARPSGRIDPLPFEQLVRVELSKEEEALGPKDDFKPDFDRPKEPLEAFKLENLRMVGTIHMLEQGELTALISDANGEIHRIKRGNHAGRNYGEIITVNETQLDLMEIVPNGRDGWMKRPRNIVLVEQ